MLFLVPFFVTHFLEPVLSKLLDDFRSTLMHMLCVLEESVSHLFELKLVKVKGAENICDTVFIIVEVNFIEWRETFTLLDVIHVLLQNE